MDEVGQQELRCVQRLRRACHLSHGVSVVGAEVVDVVVGVGGILETGTLCLRRSAIL